MKTLFLITLLVLVAFQLANACFEQDNAKDAEALNAKFAKFKASDKCKLSEFGCIKGKFAICDNSGWILFDCPTTLTCSFLPLVNSRGTSCTCGMYLFLVLLRVSTDLEQDYS